MLKKTLRGPAGLLVLLVLLAIAALIATGPQLPDSGSNSATWLQPGPYSVASSEFTFVDSSRPTKANRGIPGKPERTLITTVWYPENAEGSLPLIIHSHGIVSERTELPYLMKALASRGYVVAAANFPLTSGATEGGANATDIFNQPADVSFLIDSVIALSGEAKPFAGNIDVQRIGLTGFSLGGLTTYLTTFHPRWREERLAAAVAIAGPSAGFAAEFFSTTSIPFLAISGTADALIEHRRNAADITERADNSVLISIEGGSHLGFTGIAEPMLRFMSNPDSLGCAAVMAVLDEDPNDIFSQLGSAEEGVDMTRDLPGICDYGYAETTHPGRQQMITQIAAVSFFESVFNASAVARKQALEQLKVGIARDFAEASFTD